MGLAGRELLLAPLAAALLFGTACSGTASTSGTPAADGGEPTGNTPVEEPKSETGEGDKPPPQSLGTDEEVQAAFEAATGGKWHEDDCIGRTEVKDVILVGSFAHDRGCDTEGAFVGGEWITNEVLLKEGLGRVGWGEMSADERPAFALKWIERVLFHWGGDVVNESTKAFEFDDTPAFAAPKAEVQGDEVVATMWVVEPPGMQDIDAFNQLEVRIGADGAVTQSTKESFSIEGERVR